MSRATGIDVSHWKPVKNWLELYDSGVRFVGVKATEGGSFIDPKLRYHRDEMRRHPFTLGIYYHFARSGPANRQAERLVDAVGALRDNERLCLDFEVLPIPGGGDANLDWITAFMRVLRHDVPDRRPIIYTSRRIWRMMGDPLWEMSGDVDLWAPRYNAQGVEPAMPRPWKDCGWSFWQWSDGAFPLHVTPGVGKCDANYFRGDDAALEEYAKLTGVV